MFGSPRLKSGLTELLLLKFFGFPQLYYVKYLYEVILSEILKSPDIRLYHK
jgi:hypothetical protein